MVALVVGGDAAAWNDVGIPTRIVDGVAWARLGDVTLKIDPALPPGLRHLEVVGWANPDADAGLPIVHEDETDAAHIPEVHAEATEPNVADAMLRVVGVDHVVIAADDVLATCAQIEAASGAPLKRVKEGERGVQGFFRFGSVILEVVERRLVERNASTSAPSLWGFVVTVGDLDGAIARLGPDVVGSPRQAVQPGRRIATVRANVGLGVPLALMSV